MSYPDFKGKRVLITGGAGLIGTNLTKALLKQDVEQVTVIDDLSAAEKWNIPQDRRVRFIEGSILDEEKLKHAFSPSPDYVYHLAAHFANQNSVDHPETDLEVNGKGTLKILEYCRMIKPGRVIFASSGCSVYGSEAPLPLTEDFISLHLDTPYQITKLLGEVYCNFYVDYYKLPIVTARFFNVIGPGEIPGAYRNVIPNFMYWALHGMKLPITGTGEETRDFTYVDDIVDGLLRMGTNPKVIGQAINLASNKETKIIDLAKMINELTGNKAGIEFRERRSWDRIIRRRASVDKARQFLGYDPKTDVAQALPEILKWFHENMEKIEKTARF
ncbi:MAG: NAD-dependent epimerase/dehydratase family protein [Thaumarchaeota archaeon]|nr:NAD-dependent epimerase/dehydratase family protein [Nitrososphaerota archaeon]